MQVTILPLEVTYKVTIILYKLTIISYKLTYKVTIISYWGNNNLAQVNNNLVISKINSNPPTPLFHLLNFM